MADQDIEVRRALDLERYHRRTAERSPARCPRARSRDAACR